MTSSMTLMALSRPSTRWAPPAGLVEPELAATADDVDLMVDVGLQHLDEVERAGDAVDQRHGVDREVGLQRRVLVEVVEDDERRRVLLELDHQAGVGAGRLVVDVGDALDLPALDQLLDLGGRCQDRGLVGHLGDHDAVALAAGALDDLGARPQADGALAGAVGIEDAGPAHDEPAGREVGAVDELHQVVGRGLGVVEQVEHGVDRLAQVVGRDVGGHAHGDALAAVDQQVGEAGR